MIKLNIIFFIFFSFIITNTCFSKIEIKYKINNNIITNVDILNERNYLIFLRPNLKDLSDEEIIKISENSLIRELIKKKEIDRIFKNIDKNSLNEEIKKNLFSFKKVKNEKEFKELIKEYNISYNKILEKIQYEGLWNELIFMKFNSSLKIDKKKIKDELILKMSNDKKFEYNLSEILFELEKNETYEKKLNEIMKYIKEVNFRLAASKYSIANSSNKGGEIGWIKETLLSPILIKKLKNLKKDQFTRPIKYPNGYLILKINEKKEMKQIISIDKELEESIKFEKNKQLNQYSLLFYKKLKQNTVINEH
tara:strand:- start:362 stop:1288 length:927 start_codon:yes stop_codon:yes gene_type:complete